MNFDDIKKLKKGDILYCKWCNKELINEEDEIHFLSEDFNICCEDCHNKMFGKDPE